MNKDFSLKAMLWIIAAGFFMQALDTTIVNTALPTMARSLNELPLNMQPVIVAYSLTMAMLTPASGWLADRFGTRRVYFCAIFIFTAGSLFCAVSHTLNQLIVARVLQGIGGSMLLPVGRLAILRNFPSVLYLSAITMVSISGQVGPLIGPMLGGWLVEAISWHWIFLINLPIGLVGCAAVLIFLPREKPLADQARFDFPGFALLSTCMVAFSLALDGPGGTHVAAHAAVAGNSNSHGAWIWAVSLLALSAATAAGYVQLAKRRQHPLFPLALFRERTFSLGLAGNLIARIGSSAVPFLMPLLFQLELGFSPLESGMMMLPVALAGIVVKRVVTPLVQTYGYARVLAVNTLLVGASIISFASISPAWPIWVVVVQLSLFGAFNSMQYATMNSVTLKDLSLEHASSGNALFSMAQMLAIGLGVTVGGALVKLFSGSWSSPVLAFRLTFVLMGLVTMVSAMVFSAMHTPRKDTGGPNPEAGLIEE
jgi:DHA2 family multidrug resistance protein-like MFS transporter